MSRSVSIKNNYESFKEDFKNDTGLDPVINISDYIAYYSARVNDAALQYNFQMNEFIINDISHLPDTIQLRMGEMIRSHNTIKELMQLLSSKKNF